MNSLPKWGKQVVTLSKRVFPSGKPKKKKKWIFYKDNSWLNEWNYFKRKIETKNLEGIERRFNYYEKYRLNKKNE